MSARDDFGSSAGRGPGAGGLGNGGIGGGMGGGSRGGGAGYNGGAGSRTGLTTGNTIYGNTAFGRPGGNAVAYGMRDAASLNRAGMGPTVGSYGNFRTPSGAAMFGNSPVQGQSFYGQNMGQALSQANRAQARQPQVGGLLGGAPSYPPMENPLVDVQPGLPRLDQMPVPGVPEWTPAAPYDPAFQSIPGYTNQQRGFLGRNWQNNSGNWPTQSVPGTRSSGSTDGGYPSVNPRGAYPAGLR